MVAVGQVSQPSPSSWVGTPTNLCGLRNHFGLFSAASQSCGDQRGSGLDFCLEPNLGAYKTRAALEKGKSLLGDSQSPTSSMVYDTSKENIVCTTCTGKSVPMAVNHGQGVQEAVNSWGRDGSARRSAFARLASYWTADSGFDEVEARKWAHFMHCVTGNTQSPRVQCDCKSIPPPRVVCRHDAHSCSVSEHSCPFCAVPPPRAAQPSVTPGAIANAQTAFREMTLSYVRRAAAQLLILEGQGVVDPDVRAAVDTLRTFSSFQPQRMTENYIACHAKGCYRISRFRSSFCGDHDGPNNLPHLVDRGDGKCVVGCCGAGAHKGDGPGKEKVTKVIKELTAEEKAARKAKGMERRAARNKQLELQLELIKGNPGVLQAAGGPKKVIRGRGAYSLGQDLGSKAGGFLGSMAENAFRSLLGSGEYSVAPTVSPLIGKGNQFVAGGSLPKTMGSDETRMGGTEKVISLTIGDASSGPLAYSIFIDPTDSFVFTRLSRIAPLWFYVKWLQMVAIGIPFGSVATSSLTLGQVAMAFSADIYSPPPGNPTEMAAVSGNVSGSCTVPLVCAAECASKDQPLRWCKILTEGEKPPDLSPYITWRLDVFAFGGETVIPNAMDLHLSWSADFRNQRSSPAYSLGALVQLVNAGFNTGAVPFFAGSSVTYNTIGATFGDTLVQGGPGFTFPYNLPAGTIIYIVLQVEGTSHATVICPDLAGTNGMAEVNMLASSSGPQSAADVRIPSTSTTTGEALGQWSFKYDGSGSYLEPPSLAWTGSASAPSPNFGILFITTVSPLVLPQPAIVPLDANTKGIKTKNVALRPSRGRMFLYPASMPYDECVRLARAAGYRLTGSAKTHGGMFAYDSVQLGEGVTSESKQATSECGWDDASTPSFCGYCGGKLVGGACDCGLDEAAEMAARRHNREMHASNGNTAFFECPLSVPTCFYLRHLHQEKKKGDGRPLEGGDRRHAEKKEKVYIECTDEKCDRPTHFHPRSDQPFESTDPVANSKRFLEIRAAHLKRCRQALNVVVEDGGERLPRAHGTQQERLHQPSPDFDGIQQIQEFEPETRALLIAELPTVPVTSPFPRTVFVDTPRPAPSFVEVQRIDDAVTRFREMSPSRQEGIRRAAQSLLVEKDNTISGEAKAPCHVHVSPNGVAPFPSGGGGGGGGVGGDGGAGEDPPPEPHPDRCGYQLPVAEPTPSALESKVLGLPHPLTTLQALATNHPSVPILPPCPTPNPKYALVDRVIYVDSGDKITGRWWRRVANAICDHVPFVHEQKDYVVEENSLAVISAGNTAIKSYRFGPTEHLAKHHDPFLAYLGRSTEVVAIGAFGKCYTAPVFSYLLTYLRSQEAKLEIYDAVDRDTGGVNRNLSRAIESALARKEDYLLWRDRPSAQKILMDTQIAYLQERYIQRCALDKINGLDYKQIPTFQLRDKVHLASTRGVPTNSHPLRRIIGKFSSQMTVSCR